jgi:predicted Fe-Mo cluster-binding NifX family protein
VIDIKIAISSTGRGLNSKVDDVFGRCPYFVIVEIKNKKIVKVETVKNTSVAKLGGAGISAAQSVVEKGVDTIITGNIGPRALDVLNQFKIKIYKNSGSIKKVLQKFLK